MEKCTAGVQLEAGISDLQWVDDTRVLVALDTGNNFGLSGIKYMCLWCQKKVEYTLILQPIPLRRAAISILKNSEKMIGHREIIFTGLQRLHDH